MSRKTKILFFSALGLVLVLIILNYINSELYSFGAGNPIKHVFLKNGYLKVEAVSSPEKVALGLGGRSELPAGRGMLFFMPDVPGQKKTQNFWMRGMQFPLDIIWIENFRVIGCEKNISPQDTRIFTSPGVASMVLETQAGFCDMFKVQVNDQIGVK